ncbi:hypothetical protein GGI15_003720 [Coemansia interrupta]|uniref:BZIP domain-containing protein n=1 Tax=Coemansia interrupta TaxID=1126814 RepID=A0A9W8LGU6_9FUNG|nr:hypothetical protein GGI15_003720 [Coemansia interrupta]
MASDLGFEITAEATKIFDDISSKTMQSTSPPSEARRSKQVEDVRDYGAINDHISVRAILPNGSADHQSRRELEQALNRKREQYKLAARKKRDRKKKRLEALEQREKDLRKQYLSLSMELMLCRSANQNHAIFVQTQAASELGMQVTAETSEMLETISSVALRSSPPPDISSVSPDYSVLNSQIEDLYSSATFAHHQAQRSFSSVELLKDDISQLAELLLGNGDSSDSKDKGG